jgi:hypothetical protein
MQNYIGQRVMVGRVEGVITGITSHYIYVLFPGRRESMLCHKTWKITYLQ